MIKDETLNSQELIEEAEDVLYAFCADYLDMEIDTDDFFDTELVIKTDDNVLYNFKQAMYAIEEGIDYLRSGNSKYRLNTGVYDSYEQYTDERYDEKHEIFENNSYCYETIYLSKDLELHILGYGLDYLYVLFNDTTKEILSIAGIMEWNADKIRKYKSV